MKHKSAEPIRIAAFLLAILLFSASLAGCGKNKVSGAKPSAVLRSGDRAESGEVEFPCVNPILLNPVKEERGQCGVEYLSVSGLKNPERQNSINKLIADFASEIAEKDAENFGVPFGGVKTVGDPLVRSVRVRSLWNCNDVLSLVASDSTQNMKANWLSLSPKTIDLRTGKELRLGDLFASGVDYKKIIDSAVKKALSSGAVQYDPLKDVGGGCDKFSSPSVVYSSAYAGVTDDTPFFLHDGGLAVLLKYGTPGLSFGDTRDEFVSIGFEKFSGGWRISDGQDGEIYSDPGKVSISLVYADMENIVSESEERSFGKKYVHLEDSVYYPENFPKKLVKTAKSMLAEFRTDDEKAKAACAGNSDRWVYANNTVSCFSIGGLCVIKQNVNENISVPEIWSGSERCRIFDEKSRELKPEDFFGTWNYKSFFEEKLRAFTARTYEAEGYVLKTAKGEPLKDSDLKSLVNGATYSVSPRALRIITPPVLVEKEGEQPTYRPLTLCAGFSELNFR